MKTLHFKKEKSGRWYIVLPEWKGKKADLEMVSGADDLLNDLSKGKMNVSLSVSLKKQKKFLHLEKIANTPLIGGAIYFLELKPIWLCGVTKSVFGNKMPKDIYFKSQ